MLSSTLNTAFIGNIKARCKSLSTSIAGDGASAPGEAAPGPGLGVHVGGAVAGTHVAVLIPHISVTLGPGDVGLMVVPLT